jgi:acetoin utilization deacetylase AcuC-like enzyme
MEETLSETSHDQELLQVVGSIWRLICGNCTSPIQLKLESDLSSSFSSSSPTSSRDEELDKAASLAAIEFAKAVRDRSLAKYELQTAIFEHEMRVSQWRQRKLRYTEWIERKKILQSGGSSAVIAGAEVEVPDPGEEPATPAEILNEKIRQDILPTPPQIPDSLLRKQKCRSCGSNYCAPSQSANATLIKALHERDSAQTAPSSPPIRNALDDEDDDEDELGSGYEKGKVSRLSAVQTLPRVDPGVPVVNMDILAETLKPREVGEHSHTHTLLSSLGLTPDFIANVLAEQKSTHNHSHSHSFPGSIRGMSSSASATSTCISFDERMLHHEEFKRPRTQPQSLPGLPPLPQQPHPERPDRLRAIAQHLVAAGLFQRCERLPSREVTREEASLVHEASLLDIVDDLQSRVEGGVGQYNFDTGDTYANTHTLLAARLACGNTLAVTESVALGKTSRGIALVRPPGHHAEPDKAMGFCVYNNVGVAAAVARKKWGVARVLILDWDVHHGNGTEKMFYSDPTVLYVSLHRYDRGTFYPGTGHVSSVGVGEGAGYNVNIAWEKDGMGDADYLHAFDEVIMPIAHSFNPELVLVSAGFDAARGDPLGGCDVTPRGYAQMTHRLLSLAKGKVVVALEGGYNLSAISRGMESVLRVLLGEAPPPLLPVPSSTHVKLSDTARDLHDNKAGAQLDAFFPPSPSSSTYPSAFETELTLSNELKKERESKVNSTIPQSSNLSSIEITSNITTEVVPANVLFGVRSAVLAAEQYSDESNMAREAAEEGAGRREQLMYVATPHDEAIAAVSLSMHCLARFWPCLEAKVRAQDTFSQTVLGKSMPLSKKSLSKSHEGNLDDEEREEEEDDDDKEEEEEVGFGDKKDNEDEDETPFFDTIAGPMRSQILQLLRGEKDDEGVELKKTSLLDEMENNEEDEDHGIPSGGEGEDNEGDGMRMQDEDDYDEEDEDDPNLNIFRLLAPSSNKDHQKIEDVIEEVEESEPVTKKQRTV